MRPSAEPRATMQAIWQTRPSRRESDRRIAGVAGAIARRYDIEPTLVRVGFVVAAFYGFGILLYLAAWAALPPDPGQPPKGLLPGRTGPTSVHPVVLVAAVIAGVAALGSLTHGNPGILVGLAVTAGLLYLLHESRGERGLRLAAAGSDPSVSPAGPGSAAGPDSAAGPGSTEAGGERREPPDWDPLGAAPFAWDLPEPAPGTPAEPARRRSVLTPVTVAVALLAGGVTGALTLAGDSEHGIRLVAGVMLVVVALGLVVGSFVHRGRGLLLFAVPLLVIGYVAGRVGPVDWRQSGDLRIAPTSVTALAPVYQRGFGDVTLDLRNLDLAAPVPAPSAAPVAPPGAPAPPTPAPAPGHLSLPAPPPAPPTAPPPAPPPAGPAAAAAPLPPVHTKVVLRAGDVTVLLPPNADATLHCHADVGSVRCLGPGSEDGPSADQRTTDLGLDHRAGGRQLDIDVTVGAGEVLVTRG